MPEKKGNTQAVPSFASKRRALLAALAGQDRLAVAFSGGVDSGLLLALAHGMPQGRVLALTAASPLFPARELEAARAFCVNRGIAHSVLTAPLLEVPEVRANGPHRCYHCKKAQLALLMEHAAARGFPTLVHGANADDGLDYRPGNQAAIESGVHAPLALAGLGKRHIRLWAKRLALPFHAKPAAACLATRVPWGGPLTPETLRMIEAAENFLEDLGFPACRVRHHGTVARIETPPSALRRMAAPKTRARIVEGLRALGYSHVSLDLEGYAPGKMNRDINKESR